VKLLELEQVDAFYGPIQALRGLALAIEEGEMVALLGANGAGKTSTLRAISGLLTPRGGEIRFEGQDIAGMAAHRVVEIGIAHVPEGRELFPSMSVMDNLRLGYWTRRHEEHAFEAQKDRVMDHFPRLRERATQAAGTLSGGEQQMLVLARGLMSSPRLLLVDELSLGLAPKVVDQLFGILTDINKTGTAVLLVEQFVHLALTHTHRAYVLARGAIQLEGPSKDLIADPKLLASYLGGEPAPPPAKRARKSTRAGAKANPKPSTSEETPPRPRRRRG
jgi:branched-chain amino acid transport system ATP-binding protein